MLGTELGQRLSVLTYLAVPGTTDATVNGVLTYDAIRPIMNTPLCKLSTILNDAEEILYVVILRHKASLMSSPIEGNIKKAGFQSVSSVMICVYRIIAESMDGLRCLTTIPNGCCLSEQPSKTAAVESIF